MASSEQPSEEAPYRNPTLPIDARLDDLVNRMTLAEKAGQIFHNMIPMGENGTLSDNNPAFGLESTEILVTKKLMTHFNLIGPIHDPSTAAKWHNTLQQYARERTRLGIPITISTDPRNHFTDNVGTSFNAGCLSQWPETLGLAAIRDPKLVERFADVARQEYLALGLRVALHPQIDLATEPRWSRINATFGEDADLSGELVAAYLRGFQGPTGSGPQSVSCITKHFPGGGPQKDGEDPHFDYGKEQVYPASQFEYHLKPFYAAIEAGTRQIMPYYGQPVGLEVNGEKIEEVGFAFNRQLITGLLREKMGYQGLVCTDWGLLTDASILGQKMAARAWGCEELTPVQRLVKIIEAGCDQFGGEACPELLVEAVEKSLLSIDQVDVCVRRVLKEKFALGLFDDPLVSVERAAQVVGHPDFKKEGEDAQRRAFTLLKNKDEVLPLKIDGDIKVYVEGLKSELLEGRDSRIKVVSTVDEADLAILRLKAPYEPRTGGFEAFFHAGSLEYSDEEKARQAKIYSSTRTIVDLYLDRPAVIPEIAEGTAALLCSYGSSADAFLDILMGSAKPEGKLPFDLPRSMEAVRNSHEDAPFSTKDPVYKFGDGLQYSWKKALI